MDSGAIGLEEKSSIPAQWMDTNAVRLNALKNMPVKLGDTAYGWDEAEKKKDVV